MAAGAPGRAGEPQYSAGHSSEWDSIPDFGEDSSDFHPSAILLHLMEQNDSFRAQQIAADPRLVRFFPGSVSGPEASAPLNQPVGSRREAGRSS